MDDEKDQHFFNRQKSVEEIYKNYSAELMKFKTEAINRLSEEKLADKDYKPSRIRNLLRRPGSESEIRSGSQNKGVPHSAHEERHSVKPFKVVSQTSTNRSEALEISSWLSFGLYLALTSNFGFICDIIIFRR